MTVIAFDGKTVAADRMAVAGNRKHAVTKLFPILDGQNKIQKVLGVNGNAAHGLALVAWYKAGCNPKHFPQPADPQNNAHLIVFETGKMPIEYQGYAVPVIIEDRLYACGSGGDAARAAMLAGAKAVDAVVITGVVCLDCGLGVNELELGGDGGGPGTSVAP